MKTYSSFRKAAILATLLALAASAIAQTPLGSAITYQGQLKQGGSPVTGNVSMVFKLFDAETGGSQVGPALEHDGLLGHPPQVAVAGGLFTVGLDFQPLSYNGDARWLEIAVAGGPPLTPRQELTAAPHARYAARAGAPWLQNGLSLYYSDGNVGVGTNAPSAALDVRSSAASQSILSINARTAGFNYGIDAEATGSGATSNTAGYFAATGATANHAISIPANFPGAGTGNYAVYSASQAQSYFAGNVGIGTTSPAIALEVHGGSDDQVRVRRQSTPDQFLYFGFDSTDYARIGASRANVGAIPLILQDYGGSIGIGTRTPQATLDINGTGRMAGFQLTTSPQVGYILTSDASGNAAWQPDSLELPFSGIATVTPPAAAFSISNNFGTGTGIQGAGYLGVVGATTSSAGAGVRGNGVRNGVIGEATGGSDSYGVYGFGQSGGVRGEGSFVGVSAEGGETGLRAIGNTGVDADGSMEGVRGHNTTYGNTGRLGTSAGAVYGTGFNKTAWMAGQNSAVAGTSFDFGTGGSIGTPTSGVSGNHLSGNYGLLGGSSYGVYCGGSLFATGTKSLQIDYPFDPENRVLNHYCTEGPEPQNAYNGVVTLDAHGEAHVELPHYFEEINKDFRYQLTCVGGFAPIYIAHEIENNRFQIAGGTPGLKVSWEVKGVRNDRFVRAYGAPVEQEKLPENRGKYLRPELYGQPKERGQFCPPNPVANAAVESAPRTDPGN